MISFRLCAATVIEESLPAKENGGDPLPRKGIVSRYRDSQGQTTLTKVYINRIKSTRRTPSSNSCTVARTGGVMGMVSWPRGCDFHDTTTSSRSLCDANNWTIAQRYCES
jgi:hypothetical protein